MESVLLDAAGHRRSPAAMPGCHRGRPPSNKIQKDASGGALFKIAQARCGLAALSLAEGAFKAAPAYVTCKAHNADATAAALSSKTLQLLHAKAHGKFSTKGRYSVATVRGTNGRSPTAATAP